MSTVPSPPGPLGELRPTERAVFGDVTPTEAHAFLDDYLRDRLSSPIATVRFRSGRIDAVWGVELADGRQVVVKTHRLPADLPAIRSARDAQRLLSGAGYPCPAPLSGPDEVGGRVLTTETLVVGSVPDRHDPALRPLLAEGLARHVALLRRDPGLVDRAGPGPSWTRYQDGPWPVPHDDIVDLTSPVPGYEWIDRFGRRAADQVLEHHTAAEVVVGHADWYGGNTFVADGVLTGTFDWELVADREAVIAGFAAAAYAASSTSSAGLSTPEQVADFLTDYGEARGAVFSWPERRAAAGAAAWILAFNARWLVALPGHEDRDDAGLVTLVQQRQEEYLALEW